MCFTLRMFRTPALGHEIATTSHSFHQVPLPSFVYLGGCDKLGHTFSLHFHLGTRLL